MGICDLEHEKQSNLRIFSIYQNRNPVKDGKDVFILKWIMLDQFSCCLRLAVLILSL